MIIKTQADWWRAVDERWQDLLDIFDRAGAPLDRTEEEHWWSDGIGKEITRHDRPLVHVLEQAKIDRDHETLHSFFEKAWLAAPDRGFIHSWPAAPDPRLIGSWPSWDVLCNLCSGDWVFHPEETA